jgi:hypothetical protein
MTAGFKPHRIEVKAEQTRTPAWQAHTRRVREVREEEPRALGRRRGAALRRLRRAAGLDRRC